MSDAVFACKIDGKMYTLPKLTLAGSALLGEHFGFTDLDDFNPKNPRMMAGLIYLCIRREEPGLSHSQLMERLDEIDLNDFEAPDEAQADDPPTPASVNGAGDSATIPATSGSPG